MTLKGELHVTLLPQPGRTDLRHTGAGSHSRCLHHGGLVRVAVHGQRAQVRHLPLPPQGRSGGAGPLCQADASRSKPSAKFPKRKKFGPSPKEASSQFFGMWLWRKKNGIPKWNPGKRKHGPTPAVSPSCLILSHTHVGFWGFATVGPGSAHLIFVWAVTIKTQGK